MTNPFDYVKECLQLELKQQNYKAAELKSELSSVSEYISDLEIALETIDKLEKKVDNQEQ